RISTREERFSQRGKARKIKSEEPAPGKMFLAETPRASAIISTRPHASFGGEVRRSHGKYSCNTAMTFGDGGNHASRTSALMIVLLRSSASNFSPIALKKL